MTPAEQIDPREVLSEKNVEVRRELIRKIGVERFVQAAGAKLIHKRGDYELLSVDLSDTLLGCHFLKMLNPSIGIYHIEGVPNECRTVEQALEARLPEKLRHVPIDDTNGADYYQQGDVVIWDRDAASRKSLPLQLT